MRDQALHNNQMLAMGRKSVTGAAALFDAKIWNLPALQEDIENLQQIPARLFGNIMEQLCDKANFICHFDRWCQEFWNKIWFCLLWNLQKDLHMSSKHIPQHVPNKLWSRRLVTKLKLQICMNIKHRGADKQGTKNARKSNQVVILTFRRATRWRFREWRRIWSDVFAGFPFASKVGPFRVSPCNFCFPDWIVTSNSSSDHGLMLTNCPCMLYPLSFWPCPAIKIFRIPYHDSGILHQRLRKATCTIQLSAGRLLKLWGRIRSAEAQPG